MLEDIKNEYPVVVVSFFRELSCGLLCDISFTLSYAVPPSHDRWFLDKLVLGNTKTES